jgi:hypothetical protein
MRWDFSWFCFAFGVNVNPVYNWDDVESEKIPTRSGWYVEVFFSFLHGTWFVNARHKRPAETNAEGNKEAD